MTVGGFVLFLDAGRVRAWCFRSRSARRGCLAACLNGHARGLGVRVVSGRRGWDGDFGSCACLAGLRLGEAAVQHPEQPPGVEIEAARAELERLTAHQLGQAGWQLPGTGHPRPVNQDRDDPDVTRQSCLDLQPYEVIWVIEAPLPALAGDRQPLVADERQ